MTGDYVALNVAPRGAIGTDASRRMRRVDGLVPGVIYLRSSRDEGGRPLRAYISIDANQLAKEYLKKHIVGRLFKVVVDGAEKLVVLYDLTLHAVNGSVMHVEFNEVHDDVVFANVPVVFRNHGLSVPAKRGAFLNVLRTTIAMRCKLQDYQEKIVIDLIDAALGSSYRVADLPLPASCELRRCKPESLVARFLGKRASSAEAKQEGVPAEDAKKATSPAKAAKK